MEEISRVHGAISRGILRFPRLQVDLWFLKRGFRKCGLSSHIRFFSKETFVWNQQSIIEATVSPWQRKITVVWEPLEAMDIVYALKRQGRTIYGFGGWKAHPASKKVQDLRALQAVWTRSDGFGNLVGTWNYMKSLRGVDKSSVLDGFRMF